MMLRRQGSTAGNTTHGGLLGPGAGKAGRGVCSGVVWERLRMACKVYQLVSVPSVASAQALRHTVAPWTSSNAKRFCR